MKIKLRAFASYLPERELTNDDLSKIVETNDEWITARTGIKKRHISTGENTSDLCAKVALSLLEKCNLSPSDIDLIIVSTTTPDHLIPCTAGMVHGKIGATRAFAFDISVACSGFVYALSIAEKYLRMEGYNRALVLSGDVLSKWVDWSDRKSCVLFGDGAGGVLLEKSQGLDLFQSDFFIAEDLHCDGSKSQSVTTGYFPVKNLYGDFSGEGVQPLNMDGRAIFDFTVKAVPESIRSLLAKADVSMDKVKYFVCHQANLRILETIAKKLDVDFNRFYVNIDRFANTSSATIPIALNEMSDKGLIKSGDLLVLCGFGGGLTWGSMLVRV